MFDLTHDEKQYLLTILQSGHKELLHNLHHADSREFRRTLRERLDLNEQVMAKIACTDPMHMENDSWTREPVEV